MTKKPRTPPPPRPVQAPRRRQDSTTGGFSGRSKAIAAGLAVVLVAGVAIAFAATRSGSGSSDLSKKLAAAGCTFKTYPDLGQAHVSSLTAKVKYNSFPPTSGRHYLQPALWGFYTDALASQVQTVHNLEHGGIVIQWAGVSPSTVEQLRAFWNDSPNGMLMAPLPKLGQKFLPRGLSGSGMAPLPKRAARIALTAWTHLALCPRFDESALKTFRDAYRAKGPEGFPLSQLTPGT